MLLWFDRGNNNNRIRCFSETIVDEFATNLKSILNYIKRVYIAPKWLQQNGIVTAIAGSVIHFVVEITSDPKIGCLDINVAQIMSEILYFGYHRSLT